MATVKIETAAVIEALQQTLNKLHADYAMQKSLEQEYITAFNEWKKEITNYAVIIYESTCSKHVVKKNEFGFVKKVGVIC